MAKDPVLVAQQVYMQEPCMRSFSQDFNLHLNNPHAIVYKDAANLALVRPVNSRDAYQLLTLPSWNSPTPDCWWIYLLVGDFRFLSSLLPYPLKYIGWERKNVPRFYILNHLLRWTLKDHTTIPLYSIAEDV